MPREFKLPDLGEGIHEGEILAVKVAVGDVVQEEQPILEIETDKATTEIPSPYSGRVAAIHVKPGDLVHVGEVLLVFDGEGEAVPAEAVKTAPEAPAARGAAEGLERAAGMPTEKEAPAPAAESPQAAGREKEALNLVPTPPAPGKAPTPTPPPMATPPAAAPAPQPGGPAGPRREGPVPAAPSTRRLARELGVDLQQVPGTGPAGLVTAEDVRRFAEAPAAPAPEAPPAPVRPPAARPAPAAAGIEVPPLPDFSHWGPVERTPLRSVRRATARHMALSWSQIPHVSTTDAADITELEAFRRRHQAQVEAAGGKLTLTVFALKAAVAALKAFPQFNSSLDSQTEEVVFKHYYHLGVATDTEKGLMVPVVRDVDRKSLSELSRELYELAQRTRSGKVALEELQGGTFTITNIGMLGGRSFAPIINYPEVAILGMARARLEPVVRPVGEGEEYEIVPRLILPLILAFDHRVVDGAEGARFLRRVAELLEDPEALMLAL